MTVSHHPCWGGGAIFGGGLFVHLDHVLDHWHLPHPIVDFIVHNGHNGHGQNLPHYAGKGLGVVGNLPPLNFTNVPLLTPVAHAASTSSGITLSLIAMVGIACAALVLVSLLVRTVVVACSSH